MEGRSMRSTARGSSPLKRATCSLWDFSARAPATRHRSPMFFRLLAQRPRGRCRTAQAQGTQGTQGTVPEVASAYPIAPALACSLFPLPILSCRLRPLHQWQGRM